MTTFSNRGRRGWLLGCAGVATGLLSPRLNAQSGADAARYPERPIHWLVPFPPGGGTDTVARLLAQQMAPQLNGQSFVIENRPGAQTIIATQAMVSAKPDGYTIASATDSLPINEHLMAKVPYSLSDIAPISVFVKSPMVLVTRPDVAGSGAAELMRTLQRSERPLAYGSWGIGSMPHLTMEYLSERLKTTMTHVPYPGAAAAVTAMLGDQLNVMWADLATVAPHVKEGKIKAWAISTRTRSTLLPDVAPLAEQGMPDFDVFAYNGLIAPKATPAVAIERLSDAVRRAFAVAEVRDAIAARGFIPWGSTPQEFRDQMRRDSAFAKQIIDSRNLRIV